MSEGTKAQELGNQFTSKAIEAMTLWADAHQRILREMVELGTVTAKEGVRLYAELQRAGIDAMRETQTWALRWQSSWREAAVDPAAWYQKVIVEGVNGTQQAFRLAEESTQALTRAAERMQASTEQAGKGIQETVTGTVSKMKEIYAIA